MWKLFRSTNKCVNVMEYSIPKQSRSRATQERFLIAMQLSFDRFGYTKSNIEEIARSANLGKAAFFARFGTKKSALEIMKSRFLAEVENVLDCVDPYSGVAYGDFWFLTQVSFAIESVLVRHRGTLRACYELKVLNGSESDFFESLVVAISKILKVKIKTDGLDINEIRPSSELILFFHLQEILFASGHEHGNVMERHLRVARAVLSCLDFVKIPDLNKDYLAPVRLGKFNEKF